MHYRSFQGSAIAEIGLGTWQLGSADWGDVNEQEAFEILQAYAEEGGNFVDTADVYGMGISETVIGKFLKTTTREINVATKLGRRHDGLNGWPQNFTYDFIKRHVEDSLQHLDISQLFLEQLHCIPTEQMRSGNVFDHLRRIQQDGLIRHWGASVETEEEALLCLEEDGIASIQIIFNLFRQHMADVFFDKAREKNVALIVRVPLASGLLTGKFTESTVFSKNDHRNFNANGEAFNVGETFSGIEFSKGLQAARDMSALFPNDRVSQWALRWILDHPQVTTVIPGASKASQVRSNCAASELPPLAPDIHQSLRALYNEQVFHLIRGEY